MEFFKKETRIDFMGIRKLTGTLIVLLWLVSVVLLIGKGLNFGLDFTGGTQVEARFAHEASPEKIRELLEAEGFTGVKVQRYGSTQDILIRIQNMGSPELATNEVVAKDRVAKDTVAKDAVAKGTVAKEATVNGKIDNKKNNANLKTEAILESEAEQKMSVRVREALLKQFPGAEIRRTEFVGSEVGKELIERGGIAVLVSILATMIYIAFRFEYRLAVSAAIGLIHDAFIVLGIFSLFGFEFDLATLASILAVLGYSLNDTIVVFDRVRENFRKVRKGTPAEVMNLSINQTLSRTIMTSVMTLLVVLALLFFGGESLFGFSMALTIGIIVGTFSSIYVSGALALWLGLSRADLIPRAKVELEGP